VIQHGTIVLVFPQSERLLVAADSRSILGASLGPDMCKIVPLGKRMLFFATGLTVVGDKKTGRIIYSANDLAQKSFTKFGSMSDAVLRSKKMATYWGESVRKRISDDEIIQPDFWKKANRQLVQGIFVSRSEKTSWFVLKVQVIPRPAESNRSPPVVTFSIIPVQFISGQVMTSGDPHAVYLVEEFLSQQTARSIAANQEMLKIISSNPGIDKEMFTLKSIITVIEEWAGPDASIGGPSDILELTRNDIHWLEVKDECKHQ
jgi:hypothetical protein